MRVIFKFIFEIFTPTKYGQIKVLYPNQAVLGTFSLEMRYYVVHSDSKL